MLRMASIVIHECCMDDPLLCAISLIPLEKKSKKGTLLLAVAWQSQLSAAQLSTTKVSITNR